MTEKTLTKQEIASPTGKCPDCGRSVMLHRQLDGFNRPMLDRPYRIGQHASPQFGRPCRGSGELFTGDEP